MKMNEANLSRASSQLINHLSKGCLTISDDLEGTKKERFGINKVLFLKVNNGKISDFDIWYRDKEGDLDIIYLHREEREYLMKALIRKTYFYKKEKGGERTTDPRLRILEI